MQTEPRGVTFHVGGCRWKHAATCHQGSTIEGECDVFVEDEVFEVVASLEDAEGEMDEDE